MSLKSIIRSVLHPMLRVSRSLEIQHCGYRVLVDPKDYCGRDIYIKYLWRRRWSHEIYEQSVVRKILQSFEEPWFCDVGASYGMYPLLAISPSLITHVNRIIAIEANPITFDWLNQTLNINNLNGRIQALNVAISDTDGENLLFFKHPKFSEWSRVALNSENSANQSVAVKSRTLDSILEQEGWNESIPLCIKIDIEGGEPKALAGLTSTLQRAKDYTVIVEFHTGLLDNNSGGSSEFVDQILSLNPGFIYEIDEAGKQLTPITDRNSFKSMVDRCRSGTELSQIMTNVVFGSMNL